MEELKYFFSYSRKDSEFVLRLAKELREAGANVWLDQLDILGGEHWDDTIEKTLRICKGVIAVLSPESVASSNVMDEVSYALDEGKLVVPVVICSCDIPLRLRRLQHIDFSGDYDTGFAQLLRALHIERPVELPESAAAREPAVQDSTAPVEAEPTEPPVHEERTAQEVERCLSPEASESTPDTPDHPKPTGVKAEKASSMSQRTKVFTAICIVAFAATISTVCFLMYFRTCQLTVEPGRGSVAVTGVDDSVVKDPNQVRYRRGANVTLKAVPDPTYRFVEWSGDLSGIKNPATLIMDADKSVDAKFALKTYSLYATAGTGGSVKKSQDKTSYNHGETVTLEAVPNTGYRFTNWSGELGDLPDDANCIELVMVADRSVDAEFTLKTYSLYATAGTGGSVKKSQDKTSYNHGETVTLEAVPNTGYRFTNWSGDLSGSTNPAKLVMNEHKQVTASFALKTYSLTVAGDNGSVTATAVDGSTTKDPGNTSYKHGETVTLMAQPNPGYMFTSWSGALSGITNPTTLVMDRDQSVTANFAALKAGTVQTNSIDMKLVYIPRGSFTMGSPATELGRQSKEHPPRRVSISKGFWMGETEVTQGQYKEVMEATPWSKTEGVVEGAKNPAVYVSWDNAVKFCEKLGLQTGETYRLPTEAEWEYACRAGTTTRFSFGDDDSSVGEYAWFKGNAEGVGHNYAHPVGEKNPNPWGLYDMHGNVFEWCSGDTDCSVRGGSWYADAYFLRCAARDVHPQDYSHRGIGFRVVREE